MAGKIEIHEVGGRFSSYLSSAAAVSLQDRYIAHASGLGRGREYFYFDVEDPLSRGRRVLVALDPESDQPVGATSFVYFDRIGIAGSYSQGDIHGERVYPRKHREVSVHASTIRQALLSFSGVSENTPAIELEATFVYEQQRKRGVATAIIDELKRKMASKYEPGTKVILFGYLPTDAASQSLATHFGSTIYQLSGMSPYFEESEGEGIYATVYTIPYPGQELLSRGIIVRRMTQQAWEVMENIS